MIADGFRIARQTDAPGRARHRLIDGEGAEIIPVNAFLDATAVMGLSCQTVRTYAYALLSVWKWMGANSLAVSDLTETHLADYIRHLRDAATVEHPPAPRSINLRLTVTRSLYRFHLDCELPRGAQSHSTARPIFLRPSRVGTRAVRRIGRPSLRVKVPRRLIVPLSKEEIFCFFQHFRTSRDLAIAGLMLFCGLRSREVLSLTVQDMNLLQDQFRVFGKGSKDRMLPLAPYVRRVLTAYLETERPKSSQDSVFLNLKQPNRGRPMTAAGLRELFRYHRRRSGVRGANPHRFRHTFAADMVREGMHLAVLMRLLGHTSIDMTMRYVNLSAEDVREEFERAARRITQQWANGTPLPRNP